jgi:Ca-activated chloride channel family protein
MHGRNDFAWIVVLLLIAAALFGGAPTRVCAQSKPQARPPKVDQVPQKNDPKAQESEVVRVETDLVNIFFTATDKNRRFITSLGQQDIRVIEDGAPQEIFTFQRETDRPLSIAILIDVSASEELTLPAEKAAAREFVSTVLRKGKDEAAIVSFTGEATVEQGLTDNAERLQKAIDGIEIVFPQGYIGGGIVVSGMPTRNDTDPRAGSTAIWDAIWVTSEDLLSETRDKTRRTIILLTDGADTSSRFKRNAAIERAMKAGAVIYSIGIGDTKNFGVEKDTLRKLSERTGGLAFFPKDEMDLRAAFAQIEQELRSQYLVAYAPTNNSRDGSYRKVEIELVNPELRKQKLLLNYRQGYFAQGMAPQSGEPRIK